MGALLTAAGPGLPLQVVPVSVCILFLGICLCLYEGVGQRLRSAFTSCICLKETYE